MAGAGDRKATLTAVLVDSVSGTARKIQAEITGIGVEAGKVGLILQGIGQGIGQALARGLSDIIRTVSSAIPDLLDRGHAFLELLRELQSVTGASAVEVSSLVGGLRTLGVPTDTISQLFARLAQNLATNEDRFRELGIATRNQNGEMLSAVQVFGNIRRAIQEHGSSLLTTSVAQELFGRSGYRLMEALQASDPAWQKAMANAERWRGVVSQAAIDGADALSDTLASLDYGITSIGTQIASAVDPYLRAFVDAFATFVQSHLQQIVNFAVGVVNTVTGFISGLFGITDALDVSAGAVEASTGKASAATDDWGKKLATAKGGSDAFTTSLQNQIRAIDRHSAALQAAADKRRASEQRARLSESLSAAQAQLKDLRGASPFLGGLSAAEQALAVQQHAQDVIDAEKDVRDKRQALGDFEADQKDRAEAELLRRQKARLQENLTDHRAANQLVLDSGLRMNANLDSAAEATFGNLGLRAEEFGRTAADSFKTGVAAARGFLDVLLGAETRTAGPYGSFVTSRQGGVVGAIGSVGTALGKVGEWFGLFAGAISVFEGWVRAGVDAMYDLGAGIRDFLQQIGLMPRDYLRGYQPRAEGGSVWSGSPYLVGERGPELFVPRSSGTIVPNGGGRELHVHFDFLSMPSHEQLRELTREVSRLMSFDMANSPVSSRAGF